MKNLLITLLIILSFGTTWGQVKMRIDSAWTYTIQVKDLTDYQKECYDDSTYVAERWEEYEEYPGDLVYRIKQIPSHYTHKKPTFEGFIEYMKRKYKIK